MVFTNAYASASNCAPSRANLMSGQWPQRHGIYTVGSSERGKSKNRKLIPTPNTKTLDEGFITLAEALKNNGYTNASMGKWHLGEDPKTQGFDVNIGGFINDAIALQEKPKGGYAPDIFSGYIKTKTITINLPEGYSLANAKDLDINKSYASGGDESAMMFTLAHKLEGNKLVLTVTEKMGRGMFTPADMDNFLDVYNAAWNLKDLKVSLVKK